MIYEAAKVYYELGEFSKAIKDLNLVLQRNSDETRAYSYRGLNYSSLGEYEKAFADHERAISLNSDLDIVYANQGLSYLNQEAETRDEEYVIKAILDLIEAIRINPNYNLDYAKRNNTFKLERELNKLNKWKRWFEEIETIIGAEGADFPPTVVTKDKIGLLFDEKMISTQGKQAETLLILGDIYRNMGLPYMSRETLEQGLRLTRSLDSSSEIVFDTLMSFGRTQEAIYNGQQEQFPPQTIALDVISNQGASSEAALEPYQPGLQYYTRAA